jgi:dynactin complex subunit
MSGLEPEVGATVEAKGKTGIVRFVGLTRFSTGKWVGIELPLPGAWRRGFQALV